MPVVNRATLTISLLILYISRPCSSLYTRETLKTLFQHATRNKPDNIIFPLSASYTAPKTISQQDTASKIPFIESKEHDYILPFQ